MRQRAAAFIRFFDCLTVRFILGGDPIILIEPTP